MKVRREVFFRRRYGWGGAGARERNMSNRTVQLGTVRWNVEKMIFFPFSVFCFWIFSHVREDVRVERGKTSPNTSLIM